MLLDIFIDFLILRSLVLLNFAENIMTEKRKKVVLTLKEKLQLIERYERGETVKELAGDFNIGKQTVRDIYNNKQRIVEFSKKYKSVAVLSKCKFIKKSSKLKNVNRPSTSSLQSFHSSFLDDIPTSGIVKSENSFITQLGLVNSLSAPSSSIARCNKNNVIYHADVEDKRLSKKDSVTNQNAALPSMDCLNRKKNDTRIKEKISDKESQINHEIALYSADTLLDYMNQWNFDHTHIIQIQNIRSIICRELNISRKQKSITDYFFPKNIW